MRVDVAPFATASANDAGVAVVIGLRETVPAETPRIVESVELLATAFTQAGRMETSRKQTARLVLRATGEEAKYEVRKLPSPAPKSSESSEAPRLLMKDARYAPDVRSVEAPPRRPTIVAPLAPDLYKLQFTVTRETHDKLRRAQDLLRHTIPNGDPAAIFDRALTLLLASIGRDKLGATTRPGATRAPASGSRHIPASVRRRVWARDAGQCAFIGATGRCTERGFLEFHHVVPFAAGGTTKVENLELRCRSHNAYESELFFGPLIARETSACWTTSSARSGTS